MTLYEFMKTIHVLAASAWVGGAIISHVQGLLAAKSKEQQRVLSFTKEQNWLGPRYFAPLTVIVLIAGIVMVVDSGINFSDTWIIIGLVLFAITFVIGVGFFGPVGQKLQVAIETGGFDDSESQRLWATFKRGSEIDLVILVLVVSDMVIKPGA